MITDSTVSLYQKVTTKNAKGQSVASYATLTKSLAANLQPIALNGAVLKQWGNTDLTANDRIMFFYPDNDVRILDRVLDAWGNWYEVRGVNPWGSPPFGHYEALLIPVQGES